MPNIGQLFTSAVWQVKPGYETEFIAAWESFAKWTGQSQIGVGSGHLLQDTTNPSTFLSFGPWDNMQAIDRWRQEAEFQTFFGKARELCEDIQPMTLNLVALEPPGV